MKLKLDADGHVVVVDGKPVYLHDDGQEIPHDAVQTVQTIARLNGEAQRNREKYQKMEDDLKKFEGIDDPEAARKALDLTRNIDEGQLIAAGKVEEIKTAAKTAAEQQIADAQKQWAKDKTKLEGDNAKLVGDLNNYLIGDSFKRSPLVDPLSKHPKALAIPADFAEARFGRNFKVEDGRVVGYDTQGNKIFSRAKPGEIADFDEALENLIDAYPNRDHILRGTGSRGDGARGSNGAGGSGEPTMSRTEFDRLDPVAQRAKIAAKVKVVDSVG